MAALPIQEIPANGVGAVLTIPASSADAGGDTFINTGNEIVIVNYEAGAGSVVIDGVPAPDSGRDGSTTLAFGGAGSFKMAGPFRPRNWNNASGLVEISYPSGVTGIRIAVVRYTSG